MTVTPSADLPTARRSVRIVNTYGLHMRPATRFVALAGTFGAEVGVHARGRRVNGKSILEMTTLAAECGETLDLEAVGPDAEAAIEALSALVDAGFHMNDEAD